MSGEHLISKNQFGDTKKITVSGFAWCLGGTKEIGINSATANVLCRTHNSALSPVDAAAGKLLDAFELVAERDAEARRTPREFHPDVREVPGDDFERWMLKTTINLALVQPPVPTAGIFDGGAPARRYVEIAFGLTPFDPEEGLYYVAAVGDDIDLWRARSAEFSSWRRKEDDALVGCQMLFHGHRLWLAARGAPEIKNVLRFRRFKAKHVNLTLKLKWSAARDRQMRGR
jgi:hypothetical protein